MPRLLSSVLSDAMLCAAATYCCLGIHRDTSRHPLAMSLQLNKPASYEPNQDGSDRASEPLFPSLLSSALPLPLQLTSLSSLIAYGYFFLALASAAGTLRFTGLLPSKLVPLHASLTHAATVLTVPSFVLALFPLADPSLTRTATSSFLPTDSAHTSAGSVSSLPVASFFTLSLSCLLLFPQLFRHLPQPIPLATSASAISAIATLLLLYCAVLLSQSSTAGWWLLGGAVPLLLSSVLMAVAPDSSGAACGGLLRLHSVDVFHYSFSVTCLIWLHAFRLLLSQQPHVP